jgi:hypothetical protein
VLERIGKDDCVERSATGDLVTREETGDHPSQLVPGQSGGVRVGLNSPDFAEATPQELLSHFACGTPDIQGATLELHVTSGEVEEVKARVLMVVRDNHNGLPPESWWKRPDEEVRVRFMSSVDHLA